MSSNAPINIDQIARLFDGSSWEAVNNKVMLARYLYDNADIVKHLPPTTHPNILDFGCGEGQNTFILNLLGFAATGIDVRYHQAWTRLNSQFLLYSGQDLPFMHACLDAVVMHGVLEHLNHRKAALIECSRVLKPNGYLFIYNFPNPYSASELINKILNPPNRHLGSELQSLTQLMALVKSSGYRIIKAGRRGVLPMAIGPIWPLIRDQILNRWYLPMAQIDRLTDQLFGRWLGQANFVIAKKRP